MMEKIKEEFYELSFCISNKLPLRRALVRSFLYLAMHKHFAFTLYTLPGTINLQNLRAVINNSTCFYCRMCLMSFLKKKSFLP